MTEVKLTDSQIDTVKWYCEKARKHCAGYSISVACAEALERYIADGITPGKFVSYLLQNNLVGAAQSADRGNSALLALWVEVLVDGIPGGAWGSKEIFDTWIKDGGLNGKYLAEQQDRAKRGTL